MSLPCLFSGFYLTAEPAGKKRGKKGKKITLLLKKQYNPKENNVTMRKIVLTQQGICPTGFLHNFIMRRVLYVL
jgi:hypothetical protein